MKYNLYVIVLLIGNIAIAMDDDNLGNQLIHIICNGTLSEFQDKEPLFRQRLDLYTIMQTQYVSCALYKEALEKMRVMEEAPRVKQLVLTIQREIARLPASSCYKNLRAFYEDINIIKMRYKEAGSLEKHAVDTAMNIIEYLISGSAVGAYIQKITERLEHMQDPQIYIMKEQQKLSTIQQSLWQIVQDDVTLLYGLRYEGTYHQAMVEPS